MKWFIVGIVFLIFSFNSQAQTKDLSSIQLSTLKGGKVLLSTGIKSHKATVFVFYSPECPLTQNYTLTINQFTEQYKDDDVLFYVVVSGTEFSEDEIRVFAETYKLQQKILLDSDYKLAEILDAKVTPEVFLVNQKSNLLYHGAIDNWAIKLGSKRVKITEYYFRDAIEAYLKGGTIELTHKKAVGCFIF